MLEILLRVIIGGIVVSAFAAIADTLKPKSFAGLLAAAPGRGHRPLVQFSQAGFMKIETNIAALKRTEWQEYLVRFIFGGAITALAGIIAKRYGPEIGGLFLAAPAIFPAAATLLEKHEEKKRRAQSGRQLRAHELAGVEAAGAAMGSIGLAAFAVVVWYLLPHYPVALVLVVATLVWFAVAVAM